MKNNILHLYGISIYLPTGDLHLDYGYLGLRVSKSELFIFTQNLFLLLCSLSQCSLLCSQCHQQSPSFPSQKLDTILDFSVPSLPHECSSPSLINSTSLISLSCVLLPPSQLTLYYKPGPSHAQTLTKAS